LGLLAPAAIATIDVIQSIRRVAAQKLGGYRTIIAVPLLREGASIGVLGRHSVRDFTNRQIELPTTFADQAVIAIENVRLFDEVQARTRELTQSVEELRALGEVSRPVNSTLDPETVLSTIGLTEMMVKNAARFGTERRRSRCSA
jgi:GAF domain-containing protein